MTIDLPSPQARQFAEFDGEFETLRDLFSGRRRSGDDVIHGHKAPLQENCCICNLVDYKIDYYHNYILSELYDRMTRTANCYIQGLPHA